MVDSEMVGMIILQMMKTDVDVTIEEIAGLEYVIDWLTDWLITFSYLLIGMSRKKLDWACLIQKGFRN